MYAIAYILVQSFLSTQPQSFVDHLCDRRCIIFAEYICVGVNTNAQQW